MYHLLKAGLPSADYPADTYYYPVLQSCFEAGLIGANTLGGVLCLLLRCRLRKYFGEALPLLEISVSTKLRLLFIYRSAKVKRFGRTKMYSKPPRPQLGYDIPD